MARKDKLLDILSLAQLPLEAKIARLAHKWVGKPFSRDQAKAVVKCYLEGEGRIPELTQRLMDEKAQQERLRNERRAVADADAERQRSPMDKYRGPGSDRRRKARAMELAHQTFDRHVRENFNADTLAMMSLISGEDRWYRVNWLDAGFRPKRSALIEVVTVGKDGPLRRRFLLYQASRVLVLRTRARSVQDAWSEAVPPDLVAEAPHLKAEGWTIKPDHDEQAMIVYDREGEEVCRYDYVGRTVDE